MATHSTEMVMGIPDFMGLPFLMLSKEHTPAPSAVLTTAEMSEAFPRAGNPVLEAVSTAAADFTEAEASMAVAVAGTGERRNRRMEFDANSRNERNCHVAK